MGPLDFLGTSSHEVHISKRGPQSAFKVNKDIKTDYDESLVTRFKNSKDSHHNLHMHNDHGSDTMSLNNDLQNMHR